jgi:hypothetical protein
MDCVLSAKLSRTVEARPRPLRLRALVRAAQLRQRCLEEFGEPSGTRTRDPVIKSHMLYRPELTALPRRTLSILTGIVTHWKARGASGREQFRDADCSDATAHRALHLLSRVCEICAQSIDGLPSMQGFSHGLAIADYTGDAIDQAHAPDAPACADKAVHELRQSGWACRMSVLRDLWKA